VSSITQRSARGETDVKLPDLRLTGIDLRCVRGGREIFSGLGFTVAAGGALAVTGRNRAGKTTLLRLIAGLLPAAGGRLTLQGGEDDLTLAEQAHYLGHRDALKPALTVAENLLFFRDFPGGRQTRTEAALEAVGLARIADLPAAYLSAGQRRRLSIARLLVLERPLWLLDEPTAALDAAGQRAFADVMARHLAGGGLIIAATHGPLGIPAQALHIGPAIEAVP
jgi:heme exporter protein A